MKIIQTIKKFFGIKPKSKSLSMAETANFCHCGKETTVPGGDIRLEWVRTEEQYEKLFKFAKSFDHNISKSINPIVVVKTRGSDQWRGYIQISKEPLAFTAWHTDLNVCKPRDVMEAMRCFAGWAKVQHGGGFVAVPVDTKTFDPVIMAKLGFKRCNAEIYEVTAH